MSQLIWCVFLLHPQHSYPTLRFPERGLAVVYIRILLRVGRHKTGFDLDDWMYCTLYIHTVPDFR
jgi:hypothetical protein